MGAVCGGVVLLVLGLWVRTPMLTRWGPLVALKVSTFVMGLTIVLPALVGPLGFGISALSSRANTTVPDTSDRQALRAQTAADKDLTDPRNGPSMPVT